MVAGDVVNTAARIQSAAPVERRPRRRVDVPRDRSGDRVPRGRADRREGEERAGAGLGGRRAAGALRQRRRAGAARRARRPRARDRRAARRARRGFGTSARPSSSRSSAFPGSARAGSSPSCSRSSTPTRSIIVWRQGRCLPYGDGISYWALGEMAKSQAGHPRDRRRRARRSGSSPRRSRRSSTIATEADWVTAHLRPLVGLGSELGSRRGQPRRGVRRLAALLRVARRAAPDRARVRGSPLGRRRAARLRRRPRRPCRPGCRCSSLCSARPELLDATAGVGRRQGERGDALARRRCRTRTRARLIAEHLAQAVLPAEMQQTLLRRADGNPLFAEEYIRMLRDRGLLRREGGSWRLDGDRGRRARDGAGDHRRPARRARAGREGACCRTASVVGKVFWLGAVAAIAGISAWEAEERLHALERKEFVRRDRRASVAGETEYAVRHVLVRDVAYGQIPRAPSCRSARARGGVDRVARATTGRRTGPRCWLTTTSRRSS